MDDPDSDDVITTVDAESGKTGDAIVPGVSFSDGETNVAGVPGQKKHMIE